MLPKFMLPNAYSEAKTKHGSHDLAISTSTATVICTMRLTEKHRTWPTLASSTGYARSRPKTRKRTPTRPDSRDHFHPTPDCQSSAVFRKAKHMIDILNSWLAKRWLHSLNIKLSSGTLCIPRGAHLVIEEGASINAREMSFSSLSIGAMTYIRSGSELRSVSRIGRFCSIANNVVLGQEKHELDHPLHWVSTHPFQPRPNNVITTTTSKPAEIGHDVWIGRDAIIMAGVSIGTGAVIGCRAVVTHDIPEYAIAVGVPARVIRFRHPKETADALLSSRWWEVAPDFLQQLPMEDPATFVRVMGAMPPRAAYRAAELTRDSFHHFAPER